MSESAEGFEGFVAVVDAGSISAAAAALGLPRETLSRRLQRLEDRLGVRLLHRSNRQVSLTPAGQQLYARARPLVRAAREAEEEVRLHDGVPRGLLRVAVPPGPAGNTLGPVFSRFLARWPAVRLEVLAASRHVDLIAEGVDVALRGGAVRDERLVARRLFSAALVVAGAPAYLDRRGRPGTAADLHQHDLLLGMDAGEQPARSWPTRDGEGVPVGGRFVCNDLQLILDATRAGQGLGLLPFPLIQRDVDNGALELVLEGLVGGPAGLWLVWADRARTPPKVRAFIDHVVDHFAHAPGPLGLGPGA